jgi:hypothetical protein
VEEGEERCEGRKREIISNFHRFLQPSVSRKSQLSPARRQSSVGSQEEEAGGRGEIDLLSFHYETRS